MKNFVGILILTLNSSISYAGFFSSRCEEVFLYNVRVVKSVEKNNFFTARRFDDYKSRLYLDFYPKLMSLKNFETWIDLGAGKGIAGEEFLDTFADLRDAPNVVLITYRFNRIMPMPNFAGKINLLAGRAFEEIPDKDIPMASIITDVFGVISYTTDLSTTLEKVFRHLKKSGALYIHSFDPITWIDLGNTQLSLTELFQSIKGIKVEGSYGILKITKLEEQIEIPNFYLYKIEPEEKPPYRFFKLIK